MQYVTDPEALTPTMQLRPQLWAKRDDLFYCNGGRGGKCRAARKLAIGSAGVVTYGSRTSPQGAYTAAAAQSVDVACIYVTAHGTVTSEMDYVESKGGEVVQVKPGYLSQCRSVAIKEAQVRGYEFVSLSMESQLAVNSTRRQVSGSIPKEARRIVIVVGGGVSAAGLLWGLQDAKLEIPVLGVRIGRDPRKQLNRWCPMGWQRSMRVVTAPEPYEQQVDNVWCGIEVDPYYEAKCLQFIEPGDLFWIVGIRPCV